MITKENFNPQNRSKKIGNSLYLICKKEDKKVWYIHERYNNGKDFSGWNAFHSDNLQYVLDAFNNIKSEKVIVSLMP